MIISTSRWCGSAPDKLRVEKEIDPRTLDVLVPSILLQPLIENSIKHGLEPRIHGGTVTLRSRLAGDRVLIEVADDGVGMGERPHDCAEARRRRHRHEECAGAAGGALRNTGELQCGKQSRTGHAGIDRDSCRSSRSKVKARAEAAALWYGRFYEQHTRCSACGGAL